MTKTYSIDYQITPPRGVSILLTAKIDADDEAQALELCQERAAKLWADVGSYQATSIREHGQNYRHARAVVDGAVS